MKVTREQKVTEALKRMKVLGLSVPVIFAFEKVGKIYCSDEVLFKELDDNYKNWCMSLKQSIRLWCIT